MLRSMNGYVTGRPQLGCGCADGNLQLGCGCGTGVGDDVLDTITGYSQKLDEVLESIPRIDKNTEVIQAWLPYLVGALGFLAVALLINAKRKR